MAALVGESVSNRQIAERLFISLGTVKAHLSHVFAKLGIAERAELAREVWRRQGQPAPANR
ncbi:MAG: helix-turn-helix transcriptional regulator [Actinomycetota bacterium]|nr:helix-turn-helix transcriptional regulator [Actinomycetota bacterium]